VAKGVRQVPSRRGGYLEPFARVSVQLSGNEQYPIAQAIEPIAEHVALRQDQEAVRHLEAVGIFLARLIEPDQAYPELYAAVTSMLDALATAPQAKRHVLEVQVALVALRSVGLAPQLRSCQSCGADDIAKIARLDSQLGGWVCQSCVPDEQPSVTPRLLRALWWVSEHPEKALQLAMSPEESSALTRVARQYVSGTIEAPMPAI